MNTRAPLARKTPIAKKRATPRRKAAVCVKQRCNRRPEIEGLCITHAEREADTRFSWFIRQRDGRCTGAAVFPELPCNGPLAAAHIEPRRTQATRYDQRNVHALCDLAHHPKVDGGSKMGAKYAWAVSIIGRTTWDELMALALTSMGRREAVTAALAAYPSKPPKEDQ